MKVSRHRGTIRNAMSQIRTTYFWFYFTPRGFGVGGGA
jgi:hypothetical protein